MPQADELFPRAVKLLARREHSRHELVAKLRVRGQQQVANLDCVLDRLEEQGLLSDRRFAEVFVRLRMPAWGRLRLFRELRHRGVAEEIVRNALTEVLEEEEESRALVILCKKQTVPFALHSKEAGRCRRFLVSRGFSQAATGYALAEHSRALRQEVES